jgi:hypothetical protein
MEGKDSTLIRDTGSNNRPADTKVVPSFEREIPWFGKAAFYQGFEKQAISINLNQPKAPGFFAGIHKKMTNRVAAMPFKTKARTYVGMGLAGAAIPTAALFKGFDRLADPTGAGDPKNEW